VGTTVSVKVELWFNDDDCAVIEMLDVPVGVAKVLVVFKLWPQPVRDAMKVAAQTRTNSGKMTRESRPSFLRLASPPRRTGRQRNARVIPFPERGIWREADVEWPAVAISRSEEPLPVMVAGVNVQLLLAGRPLQLNVMVPVYA